MQDPHANDLPSCTHLPPQNAQPERRAQPRSAGVLGRIEDTTYAILRRHQKKSA